MPYTKYLFAALPIEQGYLGDLFKIRSIPSSQILGFCQERNTAGTRDFAELTHGIVENTTEDLPCSNFEGEQISQLLNIPDKNRLQGASQATVDNYRTLAENVEVIISSHHAQCRLDNPLESRLILSNGDVTLGQMLTPGWRLPNLSDVFLSCCETGLGEPNSTDDVLTLATGFLCAGARNVVSTLWSVDDLATAIFSIQFHKQRQQYDRLTALQRAQQELRTTSGVELTRSYKRILLESLEQKFEVAENNRQRVETELLKSQASTDSYLTLQQEHNFWAKATTRIEDIQTRLKILCRASYPFAHPVYWAGFISQGLR